jgi:hypothetical protein
LHRLSLKGSKGLPGFGWVIDYTNIPELFPDWEQSPSGNSDWEALIFFFFKNYNRWVYKAYGKGGSALEQDTLAGNPPR